MLSTLRLVGAVYCCSSLGAPWGITFRARKNPIFHVVDRGACWLSTPTSPAVPLRAGDVVLLPHGDEHTLTDPVDVPARVVDFADHPQVARGGGPAAFGGEGPRTLLICGEFHVEDARAHPLLPQLPPQILIRSESADPPEWLQSTLRHLAREATEMQPGADLVITRLVDVLFVQCLRAWLRGGADAGPSWLNALRDDRIAAALAQIHRDPARGWTVDELARGVAMSRSAFAERFQRVVGEPPLGYVTRWRMHCAAQQLRARPDTRLKEIAGAVGYASEAAFHRAFRRVLGVGPGEWARQPPAPG